MTYLKLGTKFWKCEATHSFAIYGIRIEDSAWKKVTEHISTGLILYVAKLVATDQDNHKPGFIMWYKDGYFLLPKSIPMNEYFKIIEKEDLITSRTTLPSIDLFEQFKVFYLI